MNQQYPQQPNQPHPQQPGWGGHPTQPGYGYPQPGYGAPAPQPPKKRSTGKVVGFSCLGVVAFFVLLGIVGALASDDSGDSKGSSVTAEETLREEKVEGPAKEKPAEEKPAKEEPAPEGPVKITAKKTAFSKSILADGSNYTSVLVTITNSGDEPIDVNPLYFAITDTDGTKHTAELGVDEKQIDTVDLAPGENISGTITGKGSFTPKYVTYTDGLFGDSMRASIS